MIIQNTKMPKDISSSSSSSEDEADSPATKSPGKQKEPGKSTLVDSTKLVLAGRLVDFRKTGFREDSLRKTL